MSGDRADPARAPDLHAVPDLAAPADRFRLLAAALDLGYALVRLVRDEGGRPVDYLVVEHNDAMQRQLGTSGAGELASVLTPGFDPAWATGFARVAETGLSERVERYDPAVERWIDALAVRVGDASDPLVAVVFRDTTPTHRHAELLRAGRERHAFLLRLSDALRPLEHPSEVMETAARLLAAELDAERVFYALVEPDGTTAVTRVEVVGRSAAPAPDSRVPIAALGEPLLAALRAGTTLVTADIATDPRLAGLGLAHIPIFQGGAAIGVPLVSEGRWVGVLGVRATGSRTWSASEIELAEEAGERAWASVERAQNAEALAEARRSLDAQRERALVQERAARRNAEMATRMRDEFLARVSHELRTPLAAILLWSRLLATGRASGHEAEALDIIERSA
jgi:GAF domain-containing protein